MAFLFPNHNEVAGGGTNGKVAFKYRVHDASIGRFLSIDPLAYKYPFYSPYAFSGNRVIDAFELEGLEPFVDNKVDAKSAYLAKGGVTTKEEVYVGVALSAAGIGAVAVLIYGPEVVAAFIGREPPSGLTLDESVSSLLQTVYANGTLVIGPEGNVAELDNFITDANNTPGLNFISINLQIGNSNDVQGNINGQKFSRKGFQAVSNYLRTNGLNSNIDIQEGIIGPKPLNEPTVNKGNAFSIDLNKNKRTSTP